LRGNEPGSHRIGFHISENHKQMLVLLNEKAPEAVLPDVAARSVLLVVAANVAGAKPVYSPAQVFPLWRRENQVKVVGHQAIRKN
jgi:hypothetical protein